MGSAQARQQALASRGLPPGSAAAAGLPSAHSLSPGVPIVGPIPEGQASTDTLECDGGQDEKIPVVFTWTHGGQSVFLAASFNGWSAQIPMVRSGNEFAVAQELPRGVHQYKFIVDDHWRYAPDQPKTQDSHGNMNNVLDIVTYQRYLPGTQEEKEAPPKFGQLIPDPNEYTLDAPAIPMVLGKSALCAMVPRPQNGSGQPPSIPVHSLCDHVYLPDKIDDGQSCVATVACTHRYGQKFSTTVFLTCSPSLGGCLGGADATAPTEPTSVTVNPLRGAVVRRPPVSS